MAALDFPASPQAGDKYPTPAVVGQPQYTFDGTKWTTVGAQITTAAPASALPLMDAATALVGTATKYAREDHVHPKIAAAPMDALAYSGMQINGSMDVSQEFGSGGGPAGSGYAIDGWTITKVGTAVIYSTQYSAVGFVSGYNNMLIFAVSTAQPSLGASDLVFFEQRIEGYRISRLGWGTASAQPITIGFWTAHARPGLYSVAVRNSATDRSYVFTYTHSVASVSQFNVATIPGDTSGSWLNTNGIGMYLAFSAACGTTYTAPSANSWLAGNYVAAPGQVNGVATTSDSFRITGVVVLPGTEAPSAARSSLIMRPYDQELLTCQRYYETQSGTLGAGLCYNAVGAVINLSFRPKRAIPSLVLFGGVANIGQFFVYNSATNPIPLNNMAGLTNPSVTSAHTIVNVASGLVAGNSTILFTNSGYFLAYDARL
jgi:hypothetical protein